SGVVDQDVEAREMLEEGLEHAGDGGRVGDVREDDYGLPAQGSDVRRSGFGARGVGVVVDGDIAALTRQLEGDSFADTLGGAGDQRGFARKEHGDILAVGSKKYLPFQPNRRTLKLSASEFGGERELKLGEAVAWEPKESWTTADAGELYDVA